MLISPPLPRFPLPPVRSLGRRLFHLLLRLLKDGPSLSRGFFQAAMNDLDRLGICVVLNLLMNGELSTDPQVWWPPMRLPAPQWASVLAPGLRLCEGQLWQSDLTSQCASGVSASILVKVFRVNFPGSTALVCYTAVESMDLGCLLRWDCPDASPNTTYTVQTKTQG